MSLSALASEKWLSHAIKHVIWSRLSQTSLAQAPDRQQTLSDRDLVECPSSPCVRLCLREQVCLWPHPSELSCFLSVDMQVKASANRSKAQAGRDSERQPTQKKENFIIPQWGNLHHMRCGNVLQIVHTFFFLQFTFPGQNS